jgi:uncharacterized protein with FMN-binding domain
VNTPPSMQAARRRHRRATGFAGLFLGCVALVGAKAITAPPTHRISLGPPAVRSAAPVPRSNGSSSPSTAPRPPAVAARFVTGQPIDIGYGIVQVRLSMQGDRITDVQTLQAPSGGRSGSIATYSVPQLRREVLAAQTTNIDTVSGASYTSEGYARSVQSALDAARA